MPNEPPYRDPNLVCPDCQSQFLSTSDLSDYSSFRSFRDDLTCPCGKDVHPEDAVMEYFKQVGADEVPLHPLSIGGHCIHDIIEVDAGTTREDGIVSSASTSVSVNDKEVASSTTSLEYDIGIARVWEPESENFEDCVNNVVEPIVGPRLIKDDSIVVDVTSVSEDRSTKIGTISSIRDDQNIDSDKITVGNHITLYNPNIQGPPWVELLRESVTTMYNGSGRAPYPAFISAFDNFVLRQMYRTAMEHGWSDEKFDGFIDDMRGWRNWVKEGLEELVGNRLTYRDVQQFQAFDRVREKRGDEIVHLSHDDYIEDVPISETADDLVVVLDTMIEIYQMCYEMRATTEEGN
jgi:hypothetical protein